MIRQSQSPSRVASALNAVSGPRGPLLGQGTAPSPGGRDARPPTGTAPQPLARPSFSRPEALTRNWRGLSAEPGLQDTGSGVIAKQAKFRECCGYNLVGERADSDAGTTTRHRITGFALPPLPPGSATGVAAGKSKVELAAGRHKAERPLLGSRNGLSDKTGQERGAAAPALSG